MCPDVLIKDKETYPLITGEKTLPDTIAAVIDPVAASSWRPEKLQTIGADTRMSR